jgi:hypothetical protein
MKPESGLFLSKPFEPSGFGSIFSKLFVLLASPSSFEPVFSPCKDKGQESVAGSVG